MCVVIAKFFEGVGWTGAKNRDRNYIPDIDFERSSKKGIKLLLMVDKITDYCEGMNNVGTCILSASLMVRNDELDIDRRTIRSGGKDGKIIKLALEKDTIKKSLAVLLKNKLTGNTIIFNKDVCYLLEAYYENGDYEKFKFKIKKLKENEVAVRTNHGVFFKDAGYQMNGKDKSEKLSAISSKARELVSLAAVKNVENPEDIINNLCKQVSDNPQLNALRTNWRGKKMRTTSQILMVPGESTMFFRPVQSSLHFDFWKINKPTDDMWVELLSNRPLWDIGIKHNSQVKHRV